MHIGSMRAASVASIVVVASVAACSDNPFTVDLVRPLRIIHLSPGDGQTGVSLDAKVSVIFSDPVVAETVKDAKNFSVSAVGVDGSEKAVAGATTYDEKTKTATFTPSAILSYSETYRTHLGTGIVKTEDSTADGHLPQGIDATFHTLDPPGLELISAAPSSAPQGQTTGIARETAPNSGKPVSFVFVFSEGVKQASIDTNADGKIDDKDKGNLKVEDVTALAPADAANPERPGVLVTGSVAFNAKDAPKEPGGKGGDTTVTFTPASVPAYSTVFRVTLKGLDKAVDTCVEKDDCTLTDAVVSDRATGRGGQLPATVVIVFRIEDPPALGLVLVATASGKTLMPRDAGGGKPDAVLVTFTEGVRQSSAALKTASAGGNVAFEDVSGKANPLTDAANGYVDSTIEYLDSTGGAAADAPPGTDGVGKDQVVRVTPKALPGWGATLRLTLAAKDAPDLTGIVSDRATARGGQLPACRPDTGYDCDGGAYVFLFAVEGLPDLYVKSVVPGMYSTTAGAGQKYVPAAAQKITVEFSEDVDCPSVTATSVAVTYDSTDPTAPGIIVAGNLGCTGAAVTFDAAAPFGFSRDLLVTLTTALRSARAAQAGAGLTIGHLAADYPARFSTVDPLAPAVVSMEPGPLSTGVPRTTTISVAFDQPMDTASFGPNFAVCDTTNDAACATNVCPAALLAFNGAHDTVTCTPAAPLAYSAVVKVSLAGGASGIKSAIATSRGGWFAPTPDPFTYTFTVEDLPPLRVLATNFSGSNGFSIGQQLEFIFSDAPDWGSVSTPPARIFLVKSIDLATVIAATLGEPNGCVAGSPCKVTLLPSAPLEYGTTYMAVVLGGYPGGVCVPERTATDKDGCIVPLAVAGTSWVGLSFTFTTESTPGLKVVATIPKDGDTGVALSPTLTVQFNNEIVFATVTGTSICLTRGNNASTDCSGPQAVPLNAWTLKPDNKTVTTTPINALDFNSSYTIVVTKDVFDKYGQTLTSFYTAAFTTLTSALIQDVVAFNLDDLEPPDSMYVRIRFTEAMDQTSIFAGSVYLTYADGFGETVPVPVTVAMPDAQTAIVTPDLHVLIACDGGRVLASGNDAFTDATRPARLGSAGTVFDASYVGRVVYVGQSANGADGYYKVTGIDIVNPGVDQRLVLAGANFTMNEKGLDWSIVEPIPALPYATDYKLHLMTTIKNAAGTKHVAALPGQDEMTFTFTTGTGPSVSAITYENGVIVQPENLFGAADVPVNSVFAAAFASALDPASVTGATVYLEERRGTDGAITTPNTFASASAAFTAADVGKTMIVRDSFNGNIGSYVVGAFVNATTVTVTTNFAAAETGVPWGLVIDGSPAGVVTISADQKTVFYNTTSLAAGRLGYGTDYRLYLKGRTAGEASKILKIANGSPVMGEVSASFTTSPAMTVISNPKAGAGLNQMMDFTAMFSRDLNTASLTDATFYATQQGVGKLTALIATNTEFKNYVTLMPVPTFRSSGTGAVVTATKGVEDYRGNPMPQDTTFTFPAVGNAPATNAIQMDIFTSITPTTGQIAAFQSWVIQFPTNNNLRNIVAPSSFGSNSVQLVENPGGGDSSVVPLAFTITPGGNTVGDKVEFHPKRALIAAKPYQLTLIPNNMSNMYRLAIQSANQVYNFTGETVAPLLAAPNVTPSGSGQAATVQVVAWFNEQMGLASVDTTTFTVRVNGTTTPISGRYSQVPDGVSNNWKVVFTPSRPLKYIAAGYDVVLTNGLKDAAGNAFAGQTFAKQFYVTDTAPKLLSGTPTGSGVATGSRLVYTFDVPIDPLTVTSPTTTAAGSILVTWPDACAGTHAVSGCIKMGAAGTQVIYGAAWPFLLPSSTTVTGDFDATKVADLAGNLALRNAVAPWSFTVAADRPVVSCQSHDAATGVVEVNFTDDIDQATVTAATFMVFSVASGAPVTGAVAVSGKKITFTAAVAPLPAGDYGVLATTGVKSQTAQSLLYDYHYYFTVP